jgi:hypothetical protein
VASVYTHLLVPRTVFGNFNVPHPSINESVNSEDNPCFKYESKCETNKTEGFAEDASAATLFDYSSLAALNIMVNFAVFSGLRCNMEKTSIMQIGSVILEENHYVLDVGAHGRPTAE